MMAEITKTNSENTEEILASIRKLISEDGVTLESQDGDKTEPESSRTADLAVVEELRGLIDEYTDLPEDLVSAVSELESEMRGEEGLNFVGGPSLELKEPNDVGSLDRGQNAKSSDVLISQVMTQFLEKMSKDIGLDSFDIGAKSEEFDNTLALLFKIAAYRWLEKNLEPLVKKMVRIEIERLAKNL